MARSVHMHKHILPVICAQHLYIIIVLSVNLFIMCGTLCFNSSYEDTIMEVQMICTFMLIATVNPPNIGHIGSGTFVRYSEVVLT